MKTKIIKSENIIPKIDNELDIDKLLLRCLSLLQREISHLEAMSFDGGLKGKEVKDLISYINLLSDLDTKHNNILSQLDDSQIQKLLGLNDNRKDESIVGTLSTESKSC